MRAIAVTASQRSELLPDVPTISEAGVPGFEADSWYGVFTTGRSPEDAAFVRLEMAKWEEVVRLANAKVE